MWSAMWSAMSICRRKLAFAVLGILLLVCGGPRVGVGQALDADAVVANLPRAFVGEFHWNSQSITQNVAIRFDKVERLDAQHVEAVGCGTYEAASRCRSRFRASTWRFASPRPTSRPS